MRIWQPDGRDAENGSQRRSPLESILNVAKRLRLRCFHRLRPCWTAFLSILLDTELNNAQRPFVGRYIASSRSDSSTDLVTTSYHKTEPSKQLSTSFRLPSRSADSVQKPLSNARPEQSIFPGH